MRDSTSLHLPFSHSAFLEEARADFKFAVKAAIVDHLFGDVEGSAHLAAADVQPVRPERVIPKVCCCQLVVIGCFCWAF